MSLPILKRAFSCANAAPIQKAARVNESNLAKPRLPSKKKSRSTTSEPIEETKEIEEIDALVESNSASPLYKTTSTQAFLPLHQPGSLASTSERGIPFSKPNPDRQVATGSPGQKENLAKANPSFVDIKANPGFERQASLMLKPILPTNPSNIPLSPPGDSSFQKPDSGRAVQHMDASIQESSFPAIPQLQESGKVPLFLSSSETSGKESVIAAQPQVQNFGNAPVPPTQMEPVENGAGIVSFSPAAPIFIEREQPSIHLSPVGPILTDREHQSEEKPQVESDAFILAADAAKKESVFLPQSELLPKIPPAEISKFEIGQKSDLLTIPQAEHSHAFSAQAAQISDRPIQSIVAVEKLDLRSAMDTTSKQQIPILAVEKHNAPASLHLPIQPAEIQRPLEPSAPSPAQSIQFVSLTQETPNAASLQLNRQIASAAPEPARFGSAPPVQLPSPHFPNYSAAQPRPTAPVERNHEEPSSLAEVGTVDVEQPVKRDQILSEDRINDVSNVAEPTIAHTANLTMESLDQNVPSSLNERSLVIEHVAEPSAPPSPEWTTVIYIQPATLIQPITYVQPMNYNIQPMGEIKLF